MALTDKLTSIADAIRTKSGKTGGLTLAQMPVEIANIKTGAELNFEIVGNPQPAEAKENTIWVDTDTPISGWDFNATEPAKPVPDIVWIYIGTTSPAAFNTLKKNGIHVYPISAKQYIGGEWVTKTAKSYQNGKWVEWIPEGALYWHGNECVDITGGWTSFAWKMQVDVSTNGQTFEIARNADHLMFTKTGDIGAVMHTTNSIDLTNVKAIHFKGEMSKATRDNWVAFHVWTKIGGNNAYWATNSKATVKTSTSEPVREFTLDVAALTGNHFLGFGIYHSTSRIKLEELTLEV